MIKKVASMIRLWVGTLAVLSVSACGGSNVKDTKTFEMCVNNGMSASSCSCLVKSIQSTLDSDAFALQEEVSEMVVSGAQSDSSLSAEMAIGQRVLEEPQRFGALEAAMTAARQKCL